MGRQLNRRDFLKLLSGSFLGGALAKWFPAMRVAEAASEEGKTPPPWRPFQSMKIVDSREVLGRRKEVIVKETVARPDFRNVVDKRPVDFDLGEVKVVEHVLADGNHLWAIAVPLGKRQMVAYYGVEKPVIAKAERGREVRFESEARLLQIGEKKVSLLTLSVNGRLVQPKKSVGPKSGDPCGGCVDPLWGPWEYQSWVCYSYDLGCMGRCCGGCVVPCLSGNEVACLICVGVWCPICSSSCCKSGGMGCVSCGGAP